MTVEEPLLAALVAGALGLAVLARATLGFGDALVAMPLLALLVPVGDVAVPLVAVVSLVTAVLILIGDFRSLDIREALPLVGWAIPGLAVGLWFLTVADHRLLLGLLGAVVGLVGIVGLAGDPTRWNLVRRSGWFCALAAGFLGGTFNVHGPPLVVYGTARGWSPVRFRAIMQAYFLAAGLILVPAHAGFGRLTSQVVVWVALSMPAVLAALLLGGWLNRRIPVDRFRLVAYALLALLGGLLIARALLPAFDAVIGGLTVEI